MYYSPLGGGGMMEIEDMKRGGEESLQHVSLVPRGKRQIFKAMGTLWG
jgi:hypothetical protein